MEIPGSEQKNLNTKASSALKEAKKLLKDHSSKVDSAAAGRVELMIRETQRALEDSDYEELGGRVNDLKEAVDKHLLKFKKSKIRQNIESLLMAVLLALFIRAFIFQPFKIPSGSMIPTLLIGDHLLVNKFIYGVKIPFTDTLIIPPLSDIKRGDVVVFIYPNPERDPSKKNQHYIKRVVGLPGDSIDIKGRNLVINGVEVPLSYEGDYTLMPGQDDIKDRYSENLFGNLHTVIYNKDKERTQKGTKIPVSKIPEGSIFLIGDNRDNSRDSRWWGFAPLSNVVGKAFIIHLSINSNHNSFYDIIRWGRIGSIVQ